MFTTDDAKRYGALAAAKYTTPEYMPRIPSWDDETINHWGIVSLYNLPSVFAVNPMLSAAFKHAFLLTIRAAQRAHRHTPLSERS